MKKTLLTSTVLTLASAPVFASDLTFGFTEDAINARFSAPIKDRMVGEAGLVYNNDESRTLIDGGIFVTSQPAELRGQVGAKLFYSDLDDGENGYGLAFGGDGELQLNAKFSLYASAYYAPSATVARDLEGYRQIEIGAQLALFENATLALGYSDFYVKTDHRNEVEFEDGLKLSLRMTF